MGIYDRPYFQEEQRGFSLGGGGSIVVTLVIINVVVYLVEIFSPTNLAVSPYPWIVEHLSLNLEDLSNPFYWFQFLTYGFLHSTKSPLHIVMNMFGLWMFGRFVEQRYGSAEFLRFYLASLIFSGVAWVLSQLLMGDTRGIALGASGGVTAVVILFVLNFPNVRVLLMFVWPIPAWVLGVAWVGFDILGAMNNESQIAHSAHLAGAAFAFIYFRAGWRFERITPSGLSFQKMLKRLGQPKLRVHDPDHDEASLAREVDRILAKISREGEASLSRKERRTLEKASRKYQQRR
jgi:membrane associated rhomboid family serine protease